MVVREKKKLFLPLLPVCDNAFSEWLPLLPLPAFTRQFWLGRVLGSNNSTLILNPNVAWALLYEYLKTLCQEQFLLIIPFATSLQIRPTWINHAKKTFIWKHFEFKIQKMVITSPKLQQIALPTAVCLLPFKDIIFTPQK
ncbi:MAG: hypothetical protein AAF208_00830 [Cyanobacteria bacterium P01_A01_bin.45]